MAPVATGRSKRELETGSCRAVDGIADFQHGVVGRCHEIEVSGEPPGTAQAALAQRRAALEDQRSIAEVPEFGEQSEQVILSDVEEGGTVGVGTAGTMQADESPGQCGTGNVKPSQAGLGAERSGSR